MLQIMHFGIFTLLRVLKRPSMVHFSFHEIEHVKSGWVTTRKVRVLYGAWRNEAILGDFSNLLDSQHHIFHHFNSLHSHPFGKELTESPGSETAQALPVSPYKTNISLYVSRYLELKYI